MTGILQGVDLDAWAPADRDEARQAIASVAAFCNDFCPARMACVEERCRLYRLEGRSMGAMGYAYERGPSEAAGVLSRPVTGVPL